MTYFLWRHFSARSSFYCFIEYSILRGAYKIKSNFFLWLSFCDMTVPSKSNVPSLWPWPLTYEGQIFFVNWVQPYKYPIYNFRSISLLIAEKLNTNILAGHTDTQTDRQTERETHTLSTLIIHHTNIHNQYIDYSSY